MRYTVCQRAVVEKTYQLTLHFLYTESQSQSVKDKEKAECFLSCTTSSQESVIVLTWMHLA